MDFGTIPVRLGLGWVGRESKSDLGLKILGPKKFWNQKLLGKKKLGKKKLWVKKNVWSLGFGWVP